MYSVYYYVLLLALHVTHFTNFFFFKKGVQSISELAGEEQTGHWAQNCKKKDVFKYLGV